MCGIVGVAYRDPARTVAPETIRAMCGAIRHRGPDDEGIALAGHAGIGMRRLSIIDLAGGAQPIANEDGRSAIVCNGEIYNYKELRTALAARGHRFRTGSDVETILHLYEDTGPAAASYLRGMFAAALWDERSDSLWLVRDRFGIKPLYYVAGPWGIAFASELKALVAAGFTSRSLDLEAVDAFCQLGYVPAPATPFADVKKLEPGHWLLWRGTGTLTVRRYWDLPASDAVSIPDDLPERVRSWLDESVTAHLVSDVPVAAFLSGGIDSSSVVTSMARGGTRGDVPHVFTARYFGAGAEASNEAGFASRLAERYGMQLTLVDIRPDVRDLLEPIATALDEPLADDSAIPSWLLCAAVGRSYKVALTGLGGDELFAGYRRHTGLLALERYGRLPGALRVLAARAGQALPDWKSGDGLAVDRVKRFLRSGASDGSPASRYLGMVSRHADRERALLYTPALRHVIERGSVRQRFETLARGRSGLDAALALDYRTFLPDDILALSDRLAMAHGLEIRVPFVDHRLVEHIFPLPARAKIGRRWTLKQLLKRAVAPRLLPEQLTSPKRGFVGPTAAWLRHELRAVLEDELSADRLARLGLFDGRTVTRLIHEHQSRRHNRETILWALLTFSVWHRVYVESPASRFQEAA